jgi:glycosyltransferase involved in cell wall biosynthesis
MTNQIRNELKVFVITSWFPNRNHPNTAPFVYNFVKNLGEYGAIVSVIVPSSYGDEEVTKNEFMTIYRIAKSFPFFSMLRLINKLKPDIIHVQAPNFFSSNAILVAKLKGIPIIATVHRAEIDRVGKVVHMLRKIALARFDKIVAVSNFTKTLAIRAGISESNVTVIYNSCDQSLYSTRDKAMARQRLQIPLDKKIMLYVGNLVKVKGVDILIECCKTILPKIQDFLLFIIGNGGDREKLESLVISRELAENIKFLGLLEPTKLPDYYNAADIFILPSLTEGHSVALLEAMASGLPVVASMVGGNKETVEDGINGFLFETGKADILAENLLKILTDNNLHELMSKRSSQIYSEKFSTKTQIEKYLKLYQSLLNRTS